MAVEIEDINHIPDLLHELAILEQAEIHVGIFGEDQPQLAMIATVQEYGMTIHPKQAQYLTVPMTREAALAESARDFPDLHYFDRGDQPPLLVRYGEDSVEPMYMLLKEVHIPERSFMRSTFDEKHEELVDDIGDDFDRLLAGDITAKNLLDRAGQRMVRAIVEQIESITDPPLSPLTAAAKRSTKPLEDIGTLKRSITYKVVVK